MIHTIVRWARGPSSFPAAPGANAASCARSRTVPTVRVCSICVSVGLVTPGFVVKSRRLTVVTPRAVSEFVDATVPVPESPVLRDAAFQPNVDWFVWSVSSSGRPTRRIATVTTTGRLQTMSEKVSWVSVRGAWGGWRRAYLDDGGDDDFDTSVAEDEGCVNQRHDTTVSCE